MAIYSVDSHLSYGIQKIEGEAASGLNSLPSSVLIVWGDSERVRKIVK
ncbi:MAG: hypothetical protein LBH90_01520 [Tannerella sp.]|nr:hypothetical protein [Tannerella sp.]